MRTTRNGARRPIGASGERMVLLQLMAVAAHHYPEADELCILVDGEETDLFSHGIDSCPHELPDARS